MHTGLVILRQIGPPARLAQQLDDISHLYQFEDNTQWVDDDKPRDGALNQSITGWGDAKGNWVEGCTKGFAIFAWDGDIPVKVAGPYSRRDKAERALAGAKPKVMTEFDIDEEDVEVTKGGARVTTETFTPGKKKPFEA